MKTREPRRPRVSGWRFYATLVLGGFALFLQFGIPQYGNLAVFPLLLFVFVHNNKTRLISVLLWGTILLITWRIVGSTLAI